jgi:hypothetical protein
MNMNSSSNHDTSWILNHVAKTLSHASSVSEATEHLQAVTALLETGKEEWQSRQDEQRRGFLMKEIMELRDEHRLSRDQRRILKAMTTSQLEAYSEELYRKQSNHSLKKLSAA